ncbi:MAG: hypothetical protein GF308_06575 [Candidatus Heimdallarchaeota archaeon]|nr:hypothetical protein [Candidatus Heimdallarchaeota archaeon]
MTHNNPNKKRDVLDAFKNIEHSYQRLIEEFDEYQERAILIVQRNENERLIERMDRLEHAINGLTERLEKLRKITESNYYR